MRRNLGHVFVGIVFATLAAACQLDGPIDEREDPPPPPPEEQAAAMDDVTLEADESDLHDDDGANDPNDTEDTDE